MAFEKIDTEFNSDEEGVSVIIKGGSDLANILSENLTSEKEIKKLKAENERLNVIIKEYEKKLWKDRE